MQDTYDLKHHSKYWQLHKQIWEEEFNNLDLDIAQLVMRDPAGQEAAQLEKKVIINEI